MNLIRVSDKSILNWLGFSLLIEVAGDLDQYGIGNTFAEWKLLTSASWKFNDVIVKSNLRKLCRCQEIYADEKRFLDEILVISLILSYFSLKMASSWFLDSVMRDESHIYDVTVYRQSSRMMQEKYPP